MSIKFRLCIGDYPLPLEDVEAETLGGIRKGYLLNLTQRGNYKWLEKALEMSEKKQKHRFFRGGGAKFKTLQEMQEVIRAKKKDDKKIPFVEGDIRGHQIVLQNNLKSVRLLLPQDNAVDELTWLINNLTADLEHLDAGGADGDEDDSPGALSEEEEEGAQVPQDSFETIVKSASKATIRAAQQNSRCFAISWRPSRMAFMVKRSLGDDISSHEFCLKEPKKARRNLKIHEQDSSGKALQDRFDACLKNITSWLDESPSAPPSENILEEDLQPAA